MPVLSLVATCAPGTELALIDELRALDVDVGAFDEALPSAVDIGPRSGAEEIGEHLPATNPTGRAGAVAFTGPLALAYRAALSLRVASRVLVVVDRFEAPTLDALYDGVRSIDWSLHFGPDDTFAVTLAGHAPYDASPRFVVLRAKDAIVDAMRARFGRRPDVDAEQPGVLVHVHVASVRAPKSAAPGSGDVVLATIAIDLGGRALHRRGYRDKTAAAPLRETLAAAMLRIAGWPALAREGAPFVDPMCGSGTLVIEAASMALGKIPAFDGEAAGAIALRRGAWRGHDRALADAVIETLRDEERAARANGGPVTLVGRDVSPVALAVARRSAERAGVASVVHWSLGDVGGASPPPTSRATTPRGLVMVNPPYGARLGEVGELFPTYRALGDVLRQRFLGWTAWVLVGNASLGKHLGLRASRRVPVRNGPIECRLLELPIASRAATSSGPGWRRPSDESDEFANRLRKNRRRFGAWAEREELDAYRVYDADIPGFRFAIDVYGDRVLLQEYEAPHRAMAERAERRLVDASLIVPDVLGVPPERLVVRVRRRRSPGEQTGVRADTGERFAVRERGHHFLVNVGDRLDTGLYLDHRDLRRVASDVRGGTFLNLFAYTATATVYAAKRGARASVSVDLSNTYLAWAEENFALNGVDPRAHRLVRADCDTFLASHRDRYDVVFLAPPSYSRSKAMHARDFDVVRDHPALVRAAAALLEADGVLYFSTHARGFELRSAELGPSLRCEDVTEATMPRDFTRRPPPHRTYRVARSRAG